MKILRLLSFLLLTCLLAGRGLAQGFAELPAGGRMAALGQAYTAVSGDLWTQFSNPAGLANLGQLSAGMSVDRRSGLTQLSSGQVALGWGFAEGQGAGLFVARSGWEAWGETRAGLSYGIEVLERLRLGAGLDWSQVAAVGYGSLNVLQLQAGMQLDVNRQLTLGVSARNLNQSGIIDARGIRHESPTLGSVSFAYRPGEKVLLLGEAFVQPGYPVAWRTGLEYQLGEIIYLRVGGAVEPLNLSGGVGLEWKKLQLDLATQFSAELGYSPTLSLCYHFTEGRED